MVWACFSGAKVGPLIVCKSQSVNAERYLEILEHGLVTFVNDLFIPTVESDMITVTTDDSFLFMYDNVPCHTAVKVTQYLKRRWVPIMKWPAQSPDLNPIENLWVSFKERSHERFFYEGRRPSTYQEVLQRCKEILKEVWIAQEMELVKKLIESMPRRVVAVIAAGEGHTKY